MARDPKDRMAALYSLKLKAWQLRYTWKDVQETTKPGAIIPLTGPALNQVAIDMADFFNDFGNAIDRGDL